MTSAPVARDGLLEALEAALGEAYRIERELPAGGMGRVFLATQLAFQRRVVVKVVAPSARAVDVQRFRQEILLSARLQHPHIVPVLDAGEVAGAPYFVMSYVDGVSLRALLQERTPMSPGETMRILRDIASALRYAHAQGIVHRDLKPENVMLAAGSVVVLDFGVAKAMTAGARAADEGITGVGFTVGTAGYMAPEQVASDPALDHRADLYAFGVVAFELCAGRAPFTGTPSEVLRQHIAVEPPDLATMRADLPARLAAVVRACLRKDPAERPQDAGVILDMLDGARVDVEHGSAARRGRAGADGPLDRHAARGRWWSAPTFVLPAVYVVAAASMLLYLLHLAQADRIREGIVAAAVMGSLLGLPIALASGLLIRIAGRERARGV